MKIIIDTEAGYIECEGIKYSFELFGRMTATPEGTFFRMEKRVDGQLSVTRYDLAWEAKDGV